MMRLLGLLCFLVGAWLIGPISGLAQDAVEQAKPEADAASEAPNRFKITRGKPYKLCNRFKAMLERHPELAKYSYPFDIPIDDKTPEIRKLKWYDVNIEENLSLLYKIWAFEKPEAGRSAEEKATYLSQMPDISPEFVKLYENNYFKLQWAKIDANADGETDILYRLAIYADWATDTDMYGENKWRAIHYLGGKPDGEKLPDPVYKYFNGPSKAFTHEGRMYLVFSIAGSELMILEPFLTYSGENAKRLVCYINWANN